MLEKIQDYIITKTGNHDLAYYVVVILYLLSFNIPIFVVGYILDILPFVIVSTILTNKIRKFCGGFHCTSNGRCFIISFILIMSFGFISKMAVNYLWLVFLIALYCVRNLYEKAPFDEQVKDIELEMRWYNNKPYVYLWKLLKINTSKYDKPYDRVWYRKGMIKWLIISLFLCLLFLLCKYYYLTSCVLFSIIFCDLMLFLNKDMR